jgi:cobalt-zinc-cadmium efflux system membrane fusion protein
MVKRMTVSALVLDLVWGLALSAFFLLPAKSHAHEGHSHGEEPPEQAAPQSGPVILTEKARKNLDIKTAEATVQPIERTVKASGIIEAIPGTRENVSSKIPGKVAQLTAELGEYKRKGEPLLILEARQLAEVPVRVPVTAPRNGKIVKLDVIKGNAVEPGTSLLELADYHEVYAVARVYESQIGLIRKGMTARVYNPFLKGQEMDSKVDVIGTEVHPQSRTVEVWLRVKNPAERLKINMTVTVFFLADQADEAIAVPRMAVLGSGGDKFVFVVEGDNHTRTPVVTGIENDKWIEIVEGLAPGDVVVTQGNYQLQFAKPASVKLVKPAKPAKQ